MLRASLLSRRIAPSHARSLSIGGNAKLVVPIIDFAGMYGTEKEQLGACPSSSLPSSLVHAIFSSAAL